MRDSEGLDVFCQETSSPRDATPNAKCSARTDLHLDESETRRDLGCIPGKNKLQPTMCRCRLPKRWSKLKVGVAVGSLA